MSYPKPWTEEQRKAAGDRIVFLQKFDLRGEVDVVLRLLEQGEITRAKAREALREIVGHAREAALPLDRLNWSDDATQPTATPGDPGEG